MTARPPAEGPEPALDCDDADPKSYPGAAETCDGEDNDCDGKVDSADSSFADPRIKPDGSCTTGAGAAAASDGVGFKFSSGGVSRRRRSA